jgi:hypothetical protein
MQPVLFSVAEAVRNGCPGWFRAGSQISYFRNLYSMPNDDAVGELCKENGTTGSSRRKSNPVNFYFIPNKMSQKSNNKFYLSFIGPVLQLQRQRQTEMRRKITKVRMKCQVGKAPKTRINRRAGSLKTFFMEIIKLYNFLISSNFFSLRFTLQFRHDGDICYIAYHFPYTYTRLQVLEN